MVATAIGNAFKVHTEQFMVRCACEELLVASRLPLLHRVQFLVFIAATVPENEPVHKIREPVMDAYYWLDALESSILSTLGRPDPRVARLRKSLDDIVKLVNDYEEDDGDGEGEYEEEGGEQTGETAVGPFYGLEGE